MHRNIPRSKIIRIFSKLGKPTSIKKIYETNNIIYKVVVNGEKYILKVYDTLAPGEDAELYILRRFPNIPHARKLILSDDSRRIIGSPYAVFPYIEGHSLQEELEKGISAEKAKEFAEDIADIIKAIAKIKTKNFGFVDEQIEGKETDWYNFMISFAENKDAPTLRKHISPKLVEQILEFARKNLPKNVESVLAPFDLNSRNFLVSGGKLKMIDLGAVLAGDLLFPLGEFMAHYYLTPLWEPFISRFSLSEEQMRIVRIYALLCDFGILRAAITMAHEDSKTAKPWGNKHTFLELIDLHLRELTP